MPSKLQPITVRAPEDIYQMVRRDAERESRSDSMQVVFILRLYYAERQRQAELFNLPPQPGVQRDSVPHFEDDQPEAAEISNIRDSLARAKK